MFVVFKNGKPAGNKKFQTYELGRQFARKQIRKKYNPITWWPHTNPDINFFYYSVRKV